MLFLVAYQAVFTVLISIAAIALMANTDISENTLNDIIVITQDILIFFIPIVIYLAVTKSRLSDVVPHSRLSFTNILYIILLTALFAPVVSVISAITALFAPTDVNTEIVGIMDRLPFALSILAMAVMPAIFEELTFRGVLLSNYKCVGIAKAAVVTGFFFGLIHGNIYQIIYAIAAGAFFAAITAYTNSIYASMLSHFLFNGVQVAISEIVMSFGNVDEIINTAPSFQENLTVIVMYLFITVITLPLFVLVFRKFMERNRNNILDYRYSIEQNKLSTLSISLEEDEPKYKIADVYFIITVVVSAVMIIVSECLT